MVATADIAFIVTLAINVALAIIFLCFFVYFRRKAPKVYQPRCDGSINAPPPPPLTLFGWVGSTIRYSDKQLLKTHGLDAVMFIKFVRMMVLITACMSLYGFIILFPVNATGELSRSPSTLIENGEPEPNPRHVYGIQSLSLSGVDTESARLVAHLFSVIINSVIVYYFTYSVYRQYMLYRIKFKSSKERIANYSVMVRGVPTSVDDKALLAFFQKLFPEAIVSVVRSHCTNDITQKIKEREQSKRALEKADAVYRISGERPTTKDKFLIGNVVDAIDWHRKSFERLTNEVHEMQTKEHPRGSVVFIVFNNLTTASQCAQSILDTKKSFVPEPAPEPRDLLWEHFAIGHHQFFVRKIVMNIFFYLLVFFWAIPVTFVSSLSNLETLSQVDGLSWIVDIIDISPVLSGFLQGFLPTLAMIIFFALLVTIITTMVTKTGVYSQSEVSRVVMSKYYAFQVVNIILIYSISGSIFGVLQEFVGSSLSFTMIIDLLANSLPKQAGFFVNYIMLLSLSGHTKALWNPGGLIVRWIKHKFLSKTAREWKEAETPSPFNYAVSYTTHLLVFTILLLYSTLAPFIMIFGVLYFCMAYVSNKYNILYVHLPLWESGGKHWGPVFFRIYAGTLLYQILLIGIFAIYRFPAGAIIAAICAVATLVFGWYTRGIFANSSRYLPLRYAAECSDLYADEDVAQSEININVDSPKIHADPDIDNFSNHGAPKSPIYERNKYNVTNVNSHQYYFQPSLVPLSDEPEFVLAKGQKAKLGGVEWNSSESGISENIPLEKMEKGRSKAALEDMEEISLSKKAKKEEDVNSGEGEN